MGWGGGVGGVGGGGGGGLTNENQSRNDCENSLHNLQLYIEISLRHHTSDFLLTFELHSIAPSMCNSPNWKSDHFSCHTSATPHFSLNASMNTLNSKLGT